jgi:chromosome segregation ATPase
VSAQANRFLPLVLALIFVSVCFTTSQRLIPASAQEETNIASPTPEASVLPTLINQLVVIHRRMRAANERLERFTERLDACLTQLKKEGKNTFIAEQFLNQAKAQLRDVEKEVLELDVAISSAAYSTPPYTELSQAIAQVKKTKSSLTGCLETIKKAVREARHAHETI